MKNLKLTFAERLDRWARILPLLSDPSEWALELALSSASRFSRSRSALRTSASWAT